MLNCRHGNRHRLITKSAKGMANMSFADSLFADEIGNHGASRSEDWANVTEFGVLTTEMLAHLHMTCGRLVSRMKGHGDGALVVTEEGGWITLTKTEVT